MRSTSQRAADPRPARTRTAIFEAVARLSAAGEDIGVNAVAREAGVSRSTFYAQFADLDALAFAMIVDAFREIGAGDRRAREAGSVDARALATASVRRLVEHLDARRAFYRASLDWRVSSRVREGVIHAFAEQVRAVADLRRGLLPTGRDADDASLFIAGGVVALLTDRLRRDEDPAGDADAFVERVVALLPEWLIGTPERV